MELSEQAEEMLEMLYLKVHEAGRSPGTDLLRGQECFKELAEAGYLNPALKEVLTEKGVAEGRLCVRRHRLAERLLTDVLLVKDPLVHEAGCKLEHILHKGLEDNICTLLGHPRSCPHGQPIPAGRCCRRRARVAGPLVMRLSELQKGAEGTIAWIQSDQPEALRKIMAMGTLPGTSVRLLQRFPSYVFQAGQSQFAVDESLASLIHVWVKK